MSRINNRNKPYWYVTPTLQMGWRCANINHMKVYNSNLISNSTPSWKKLLNSFPFLYVADIWEHQQIQCRVHLDLVPNYIPIHFSIVATNRLPTNPSIWIQLELHILMEIQSRSLFIRIKIFIYISGSLLCTCIKYPHLFYELVFGNAILFKELVVCDDSAV